MAYVGAPYNFSSLPEHTIERNKEEIPALDRFESGLKSGEIYYTITTMTDTMIGDHTGRNFYKNIDGKYAVKSSTARGLVRSNMQILSLSSIYDDINGDFSMMYRKVGSAASELKKTYETILGTGTYRASKEEGGGTVSIRKNVKAGFLYHNNEDGKYYIYPSMGKQIDKVNKGEQNYYILRENQIIGALQRPKDKYRYQYLTTPGMNVLMYDHRGNYPFRRRGDVDRNAFNPHFRPSAKEIDFHVGMHEKIDEVAAPGTKTGAGWHHGYMVSSGYMNKKKAHYILEGNSSLSGSRENGIPVPDESIRAYEADYEARKNLFGTTQSMRGLSNEEKDSVKAASREFYRLPAKGKSKPVFYIDEMKGHMYFGFTPNLRLYYNHTIEEGVSEEHKKTINDYTKTIFGYSLDPGNAKGRETGARKGRVSFSDAVIVHDAEVGKPQNLVLGGPKPTSYYDYLEQEKNRVVTYNDEGIRIRGYKQYWLREKAKDASVDILKNARVAAPFTPLKAGAKFKGVIRFNNLSDDELGLLLWSIRLEKNCQHNIGKAKAYGYGRIKIDIDTLRLFDLEKLYGSDVLNFNPYDDYTVDKADEFIQIYKDKVSKILKKNVMEVRPIAEFLLMKDAGSFVPEADIRYMDLAQDYRDRENEKNISKRGLPHPDDVKKNVPDYLKPAFKASVSRPVTKAVKADPVRNSVSAPQTQKPASPTLGVGSVVEGVVNGYYPPKGAEKHGVFLTLPGLKRGLLHESNASRKPCEYPARTKIKVKIIEYGDNGKRIGLTDKDVE